MSEGRPRNRLFGTLRPTHKLAADKAAFHPDTLYRAVMDEAAMWDPATMDRIIKDLPASLLGGMLAERDLYLVLAECIANAAKHSGSEALSLHARRRGDILLLSFFQIPPMVELVADLLAQDYKNQPLDLLSDRPGGLGIPILLRLAHRVTITSDRTRLQLWFRMEKQS